MKRKLFCLLLAAALLLTAAVCAEGANGNIQYFLVQMYVYGSEEDGPEQLTQLMAVDYHSDTGMMYMLDPDDLDEEPEGGIQWNGSTATSIWGEDTPSDTRIRMDAYAGGVMAGYIQAEGQTMYLRYTPVFNLGDDLWMTLETSEMFAYGDEDALEGESQLDTIFMNEVTAFARANGLSMEEPERAETAKDDYKDWIGTGPNTSGGSIATNQLTQEMLDYYVMVEGQKHIREFIYKEENPNDFPKADHMQLPVNERGITQTQFEQLADEYAAKNGPSNYKPVESWRK